MKPISPMTAPFSSSIARYLATAYALLVIYASLHPFSDWSDTGTPLLDFLNEGWPRYYTWFDIVTNMLAYVPLGFFLVPALHKSIRLAFAVVIALVLASTLSFSMEIAQHYLPTRVPSSLDFASNSLGALLGAALGMIWGRELLDGGRLHDLRMRLVVPGKVADFSLIMIAFWLVAQLNPEILLFGTGDLRSLLELEPLTYSAKNFFIIEIGITTAGTLSAGLIGWLLMVRPRRSMLGLLFVLALVIHACAGAVLLGEAQFDQWITPGNMIGLALGGGLLMSALYLPTLAQQVLAAMALFIATALVNLAPENPYLAATLQVWQQGHFLNFNGLTRVVSSLWPFAALPCLMLSRNKVQTN